ncbi:MAG: ribonuclease HIII [Candidatus Muirbacterium halophilum]|nr:ribonuclease HIII [Candidatus Muirbacterium halophilum]MCK9475087.1 ribonuclease HIII [Candidatus Muirbacterium halophilum]
MPVFTQKLEKTDFPKLEQYLIENNFSKESIGQYQLFYYKNINCTVILYSSGKVVFSGKSPEFHFENWNSTGDPIETHIGSDEAGKGDFFGPLVVCASLVDEKTGLYIKNMGITESKGTSSEKIFKMSQELKKIIQFETIKINPPKYNELIKKFKNLNSMLAWAHEKAVNTLAEKTKSKADIIIDKFASVNIKSLHGNKIIMETHAEKHIAVAVASVIAKAEVLYWFKNTSKEIGIKIPLGATNVKSTANSIISKLGREKLDTLVKTHFKTYKELN